MIEDGNGDFRVEICPGNKRDRATLIPLIQSHVAQETIIRTDGWRAYRSLPDYGYSHEAVVHSQRYVSPEGVHTQRIEAQWRPMKAFFRGRHIADEHFADHVVECQWRRCLRRSGASALEDLFCTIRQAHGL